VSGESAGLVVALIGPGTQLERQLAVACAGAGADLAFATTTAAGEEEFALNSIANEAWAIGREQFVTVLDATDPTQVMAFAEQVWDRYGRCDVLVCAHHAPATAPLDELSPDEWRATLEANLSAPFYAAQAFGRLMERAHGGVIVFLTRNLEGGDAAFSTARAGIGALSAALNDGWHARGVTAVILHGSSGAETKVVEEMLRVLAGLMATARTP
jgi:NAD(P)-dependent dehydrogenase (short-subunit alcohol dehydrogenase family)